MDRIDKRVWQIRALARVTERKYRLPLAGALQIEYMALRRLQGSAA